jgi:beta-lactamase regulating signal transducer with metallopeptidase domain
MMGPIEIFQAPAWRPLTWTLLHFVWQGAVVAAVWAALFRMSRARGTQFRYLLGLAGMVFLAACPLATFGFLEFETAQNRVRWEEPAMGFESLRARIVSDKATSDLLPMSAAGEARESPAVGSDTTLWRLDLTERIGVVQPYLLCGWLLGLVFLSGRLLFGAVGVRRLGRGRLALSGDAADRAVRLAARMGFRKVPGMFSSRTTCEAVVMGLLRPMVLLPATWLVEMTPEVLEAVIAHELAHIRRHDLWINLFQRCVETLLFYHPAVWWLSHRVRLAREMCCDEMAAGATGERVVYVTALELAARKRLEPAKTLLEVALGVTRMTLLDRVRNVLGLAARHEQGRWWPAAVLTLLAPLAIWLASTSAVTSADEEKPAVETKKVAEGTETPRAPVDKKNAAATPLPWSPARMNGKAKSTVTVYLQIAMQESPVLRNRDAQVDRDRFDIYKNTQAELLRSRFVLRAALRTPKVAKLASVVREQAVGNVEAWLGDRLTIQFPGKAEIMAVSLSGDDRNESVVLLNAIVDAYLSEVVDAERSRRLQHLSELEKLFSEREMEVRKKREVFKSLTKMSGASDSGDLAMSQRLALEQLTLNRQEMAKFQREQRQHKVELAVQKAFLEDAKEAERAAILKEIKRLEVTIAVSAEQEAAMKKQLEAMQSEATQFGRTSVEMDMMRADLKNLEVVQSQIASEMEKLKVEINSAPRVVVLERAE